MNTQFWFQLKDEIKALRKEIDGLNEYNKELSNKLMYKGREMYDTLFHLSEENLSTVSLRADQHVRVGGNNMGRETAGIEGSNKGEDIVFWAGGIKEGKRNPDTDNPFYVKANGNFNFGNDDGHVKWDGIDLNIKGNIVMTGGSISWEKVTKPRYTAGEVGAVVNTQTAVFNTLTNNGEIKGLFMNDNQLYVNADYIEAGTLIGFTIKTAGEGARIELTENGIRSYSSGSTLNGLVAEPNNEVNFGSGVSIYSRGIEMFSATRSFNNFNIILKDGNDKQCGTITANAVKQNIVTTGEWVFNGGATFKDLTDLDGNLYATQDWVYNNHYTVAEANELFAFNKYSDSQMSFSASHYNGTWNLEVWRNGTALGSVALSC